jgi:5'-deoxynucleotidase YfbR-like HD superfamily hydrolase
MSNLKNLFNFISEYESVKRFSRNHLVRPENLVQHVGVVSTICAYIVNKMTEEYGEELWTAQECCSLMMRVVVHDADEIVTGDIVRPTKYATPGIRRAIKELAAESMSNIIERFDLPTRWEEDWRQAKEDNIGQVLKVADTLAVVLTCYREVTLYSNNQFRKVASESLKYIKELIDTFNGIIAELYRQQYDECGGRYSEALDMDIFMFEFMSKLLIEGHDVLAEITGTEPMEGPYVRME